MCQYFVTCSHHFRVIQLLEEELEGGMKILPPVLRSKKAQAK